MSQFDVKYTILLKDKFTNVASRIKSSLDSIDHKLAHSSEKLKRFGKSFGSAAKDLVIPVAGLVLAVKEGIHAADQQEVAIQILNNTLGKHNKYIKQITESSEKYERVTRFSEEATLSAAQTIAQFTKSGRMAKETILPLMNMASALHMGLNEAALMFSKSLTSPVNQLQRYGVVIKKGLHGLAKYKAMLDAINSKFKGTAKTMGKTGAGRLIIAGNLIAATWKDVAISVLPTIDRLARKFSLFMEKVDRFVQRNPKLVKVIGFFVIGLMALSVAGLALAAIVTAITLPLSLFGLAVAGAGLALDMAFAPITLIIAGIAALVVGITYAYKHFKKFRDIVNGIGEGIAFFVGEIFKAVHAIGRLIGAVPRFFKSHHIFGIGEHKTSKLGGTTPAAASFNHNINLSLDVNDRGSNLSKANMSHSGNMSPGSVGLNMAQTYHG